MPVWEEGGFAKYIESQNKWINYSNVDYRVMGNSAGSSRIKDIIKDTSGILWLGTWRGLIKFNPSVGGSSIEFRGPANSPHPGGKTTNLALAPDGTIWMSVDYVSWGNGGLLNYNPYTNMWRYWGYGISNNNWPPSVFYTEKVSVQRKQTSGYLVWVQSGTTFIMFDSDTQLFTVLPGGSPGTIALIPGQDCIDELNNFWAIRRQTVNTYRLDYRTQSGNWVTPPQPPVGNLLGDIWAFTAYGNGMVLLVDQNSVVWNYNGTAWHSLGAWKDEAAYTYDVEIDQNGNVWASGTGGAAKRNSQTGQWQRLRITNSSQIDYFVRDISIDNSGNIWMSGNAGPGYGGFQLFDGERWTGFNNYTYGLGYNFPFPSDNVDAIFSRPSNGNVIINPMFNGLHAWNGNNYFSLNYPESKSIGIVEDSQNRLWSLGEYYSLKYFSNNTWVSVQFDGWGNRICRDLSRAGTIWASSGFQLLRTDGTYRFTRYNSDFPELDPQSDLLTTVASDVNGIAWVGSNKGLFKVNAESGSYQFFSPSNSQIPGDNIFPFVVSPDGRLWFSNFGSSSNFTYGLCWYDGSNFGIFPQNDTILPHAQIKDIEVKSINNGYELWISCLSRGIAVLKVITSVSGVAQESGSPSGFRLFQNYPNPFNPVTHIEFSLDEPGDISLKVYNISGEEVKVLLKGYHMAGIYKVDFDGSGYSSGIYFYRLETGEFTQTRKMILIK